MAPRQRSPSLMVVLPLMRSSIISVSRRPTPKKSIPSLFKVESPPLQSGTILRAKGLPRGFDTW